jgi:hypothetical protein
MKLPLDSSNQTPAAKPRRKSISRERGHANLKADAAAGKPRIRDMAPRRRARNFDSLVPMAPKRTEVEIGQDMHEGRLSNAGGGSVSVSLEEVEEVL